MTNPPNRIGTFLGPDARTATDLYNRLGDLTLAVQQSNVLLAQVVGRLDTAQSQNGSVAALLTDIRNAIGAVSSPPANYTVRRLLALIQECICEAPPVLGEGFTPPAGNCLGDPANWQECTLNLLVAGEDIRTYSVSFPASLTNNPALGNRLLTQVEGVLTQNVLAPLGNAPYGGPYGICIAYEFDASTPIFNYAFTTNQDIDDAIPYYFYGGGNSNAPLAGTFATTIPAAGSSGNDIPGFIMNIAFDGVEPIGKVWVSTEIP